MTPALLPFILLLLLARAAHAAAVPPRAQAINLNAILQQAEPLTALGQALSHSPEPDPQPTTPPAWAATYPLRDSTPPTLISSSLVQQIIKGVQLAGATYCPSVRAGQWDCGLYCDAFPAFELVDVTDEAGLLPLHYIGWNPPEREIIVAHQGAQFRQFLSMLALNYFGPSFLDPRLRRTFAFVAGAPSLTTFSPIPAGPPQNLASAAAFAAASTSTRAAMTFDTLLNTALVSTGFQSIWTHTYPSVRASVLSLLRTHPDARTIFLTGHSLGAILALLDGIALRAVVPRNVRIEVSVTGQPRLGNPVFAALVDALVDAPGMNFAYRHTVNYADTFAHVPPLVTGYQHSSHEVWISAPDSTLSTPAFACPGRENIYCANSIPGMDLTMFEHPGPYFGWLVGGNCSDPSGALGK